MEKLRDRLLGEENLNVPKVAEQIQKNINDRKNKNKTLLEAFNQTEKKLSKKPLYTKKQMQENTETKRQEKRPKKREIEPNCRYCNAASWNANQKCPAQESECQNE